VALANLLHESILNKIVPVLINACVVHLVSLLKILK